MKNNKGFTLIELLAVVVILLAISVIAITSISAAIERNKAKQDATKQAVIVGYAKIYYENHKNNIKSKNGLNSGCISLLSLNLTEEESKDANGTYFAGYVKYNAGKFEYVADPNTACPYSYVDQ